MPYKINAITGELDYCLAKARMPYQASPTAATLRDALITAGLMDAAPPVVLKAKDVHFDGAGDRHIATAGDEHMDWEE